MDNYGNVILVIDISSNSIKVGLVSENLKLIHFSKDKIAIINEDIDGFIKSLNMDLLWNKIVTEVKRAVQKAENQNFNLIGISSCAQRIASVFLDRNGNVIYGGPNIDIRGLDSAYLIDDEFSEEDLFKITGHSPSFLFPLPL
ncbi:MAG: FGGY family carbohydrate kinase [Candidatus Thorarchaeota archaeon]